MIITKNMCNLNLNNPFMLEDDPFCLAIQTEWRGKFGHNCRILKDKTTMMSKFSFAYGIPGKSGLKMLAKK
jgi:hypothetical protein